MSGITRKFLRTLEKSMDVFGSLLEGKSGDLQQFLFTLSISMKPGKILKKSTLKACAFIERLEECNATIFEKWKNNLNLILLQMEWFRLSPCGQTQGLPSFSFAFGEYV